MSVVKGCLNDFCGWSGQRVNFHKSKIMFSNVVAPLAQSILDLASIPCIEDIGMYLGLHLLSERMNNSSFQHLY